jgi:exopolysaccharide biosynthesis polyprenyl glycosylphosphotransferase
MLGPNPFIPPGAALFAAWILAMQQLGMYDPGKLENSVKIARSVTRAAATVLVLVIVANFVVAERVYSRALVLGFVGGAGWLMLVARLAAFRIVLALEEPPTAVNAVVIGVDEDGAAMAATMLRDARHVCRVVGHLRSGTERSVAVPVEDILGSLADLQAVVNEHDVRGVILATRELPRAEALRLAVAADRMGLRVLQAPYSWGAVSPRLGFVRVGGLDFIDMVGIQYPTLGEQFKRSFDLAAVVVGGILVFPFLAVVALLVKLQDRGPVVYTSDRLGRGGRRFPFYKFRTMVTNAEDLRDTLAPQNDADGRLFKMDEDPRVTPLGRVLRKFSIDEFPQLWNVLRGEMNLVGPRPLPARDLVGIEHDDEMRYWFEQRSKVKPGITGLWQVSGRSDLNFADMMRLDIRYIQEWSPWLDMQILLKTVPAVLRGHGAR